jgi:hypothetical protein
LFNLSDCGFVQPVKEPYLNDLCKNSNRYNPIALRLQDTDLEDDNNFLQTEIKITPNPTHNLASISFDLSAEDEITIKVLDMMGQELKEPISKLHFLSCNFVWLIRRLIQW